jgi:pimeloyl-ACP methyl ester carboxylesterase
MATFVLVHGPNVGGWCWRLVSPALRYAGHDISAPSLTGCGDRAHLLTPGVGLETWIDDVTNLLFYEDLDNVVLVGHSNGGAVVTGVADRVPERIAHVVYLDAWILRDRESIQSLWPDDVRTQAERQLAMLGETWKSPGAPVEAWVEMARTEGWNEVIARWAGLRHTPDPVKPVRDQIKLRGGELVDKLPRTLIRCIQAPHVRDDLLRARAGEAGWPVVELDAGDLPMLSAPQVLAEALLRIAEPYGA